jgi:RNA polymerase sigma-70 factor (ECF subfamily)
MEMSSDASFGDLLARLRAGDPDAAAAVFHRFAHRLIGLARRHLDRRLLAKVDPEDVIQSVFKSFFLRYAEGQFDLGGWDSLWSLLTRITLRKCGRWAERFLSRARNIHHEVSPPPEGSAADWEALAGDPTPAEAAMLAETVEAVLRDLQGRDRDIVALGLQGYSAVEISARLGRPERTVYRVLGRVKKRLQQMQLDNGET